MGEFATQGELFAVDPLPAVLGETYAEFVSNLPGPAVIRVAGADSSRQRVIVTLLHGNEPSGVKAVHRLLRLDGRPATDMTIIVAAVDAAQCPPAFSHRYLPSERDLNRCFAPGGEEPQDRLAAAIVKLISDTRPELVVDTHNTSSHSLPFCVASHVGDAVTSLASNFAVRLVILSHSLGTLLEHSTNAQPIVTVEFGGNMDPGADELAYESLRRVWLGEEETGGDVALLEHPFRLETRHKLAVAYSSSLVEGSDLTVLNTIDQLNFMEVEPGTPLGWYFASSHRSLTVADRDGRNAFHRYFDDGGEVLTPTVPMTIFMATTDPAIANSDCLFYFVPRQPVT